jgi:hypothetical protein
MAARAKVGGHLALILTPMGSGGGGIQSRSTTWSLMAMMFGSPKVGIGMGSGFDLKTPQCLLRMCPLKVNSQMFETF